MLEAVPLRGGVTSVHWLQLHEEARVLKAIVRHVVGDSADVVGLIVYGIRAYGREDHLHRV